MSKPNNRENDHAAIPFRYPYGEGIGRGKDNVVVNLGKAVHQSGYVLKWNHDYQEPQPSVDEIVARVAYKKNKYEILKAFLGDFIPESMFLVGDKTDNGKVKSKEYTVQQKVPDFRLGDLSGKQLTDPRLICNFGLLMCKLENMYLALGNVNARTGDTEANLDGKLDLGGVSDVARQYIETGHTIQDVRKALAIDEVLSSPNICVDPESLNIYCVDFDTGVWTPEKDHAKDMLFELLDKRPDIQAYADLSLDDYAASVGYASLPMPA